MITLRRTELQQLIGCEAAESDESEPANFGSLFHRCVEAYWDRCMQAGGDVPEEFDSIIDAVLGERAWGVDPVRFVDLRKVMDRFVWSHTVGLATFASTERKLRAVIDTDTEPFLLTGTVDRSDWLETNEWGEPTVGMITDYKTHHAIVDVAFQMRVYGNLLIRMHPSVDLVVVRPDFVRIRQGEEFDEQLTRTELEEWWDVTLPPSLLTRVIERKRERDAGAKMTPTGGSACQYCRLRWSCAAAIAPARTHPQNEDEARGVLAEVIRLDAAVKARKDALRPWVVALGTVTASAEVDGADEDAEPTTVTKAYGATEPKVKVTDPERAVELGVAAYTKPRVLLRKGTPVAPMEQGA